MTSTLSQKMIRWILWLLAIASITGCDQAHLNHPHVTSDFEERIKLTWNTGEHVGTWTYEIPDMDPYGHQAMYSLYLFDGERKHLMETTYKMQSLPSGNLRSGHEELSSKAAKGGWNLWMDYELFSADGDLLLKGSKLSVPSPKLEPTE